MKLPSSQEMKNLDLITSKTYGIPSIVLMENAGLGTVRMAENQLGSASNTFAPIFVGPGNNGGDGLVIGRHLHQRGCQPIFFFLVHPDNLKGDSAVNLNIIDKLRLPFHIVDNPARVETIPVLFQQFESRGFPCFAIFDAIFGIGLTREVTDHYADTVTLINQIASSNDFPVISVDTPSGVDSDTGKVLGTCVQADYTATYGCAKTGHFIHGSTSWTGKLEIIDIGIPPEAIFNASISTEVVTHKTISKHTQPLLREQDSHKGSHGHLLILAGSAGKTGAAILAAKGGLRSGAGLATLCVPANLNLIFESSLHEAMTIALPYSVDYISDDDWPHIKQQLDGKQAIVIGPGMGMSKETCNLVIKVYQHASCPVVVDADGLNILAENRDKMNTPAGPRIFTPHPGELSRLLDRPTDVIQGNRLDAAILGHSLFSNEKHETVLVLKGAGTIIAGSGGQTIINTTGNPGMATGGMGDVLSGIIGGLLCQGLALMDSAVAGVYLHGAAADRLYEKHGPGFSAGEVADMLPPVILDSFQK